MIIPDYNKGTINVHLKLDEKDMSLGDEAIAAKAFMSMTGLKPVEKVKSIVPGVEYQVFQTESFKRIYITCGRADLDENVTITSYILVKDKTSNDVIVSFISAVVGDITVEGNIIPIIDFLHEHKNELMTTESDVII